MKRVLTTVLVLLAVNLFGQNNPLPSFTPNVNLTVTQIGETIFSGSTSSSSNVNTDAAFWQTNVASGGTLPIFSVSPAASSWVNLESNTATFDGSTITCTNNGHVNIVVKYGVFDRQASQQIYRYVFSQTAAGTNYLFVTNVVGSAAHHISTNTSSRATGAVSKRNLWTTRDVATTTFIRNPSFFLADVNGIESYPAGNNSACCPNQNGCLISPRHVLGVKHTGSYMGMTLYFVNRTNNAVLSRTVIDWTDVAGTYELTCALLDAPLPASYVPAAVITNLATKLPHYSSSLGVSSFVRKVPAIGFSQLQTPGIFTWTSTSSFNNTSGDWSCPVYPGDSGTPVYIVVSNRLAVVSNYSAGDSYSASGSPITTVASQLQTAMNLLCSRNSFTNEALAGLDLAGFASY